MTCWLFCLTLPSIKATVDSAKAMSCNPVERSSPMATGHKECQPILDVVSENLYCIQCFAGRNPLSILPVYLPLSTQGPLCKKKWMINCIKEEWFSISVSVNMKTGKKANVFSVWFTMARTGSGHVSKWISFKNHFQQLKFMALPLKEIILLTTIK